MLDTGNKRSHTLSATQLTADFTQTIMGGRGSARGTQTFSKNDPDNLTGGGGGADVRDDMSTGFFNGDVEFDGYGKREKALMKKLTGENIDEKTFASLIGAPDGAFVTVTMKNGGLNTIIEHPYISEMERFIGKDSDGDLFIKNDMFFLDYNRNDKGEILNTKGGVYEHNGDKPSTLAPAGFGASSFANQVDTARKIGVSYIKTYALRNDDPTEPANGSYTWARFGYNGRLDSRTQSRLLVDPKARTFRNVKTVHELMRHSQDARNWWRDNHVGFEGIFSLERGSTSLRVFNSYKRQRGINTGRRTPSRDRGTGRGNEFAVRIPEERYEF